MKTQFGFTPLFFNADGGAGAGVADAGAAAATTTTTQAAGGAAAAPTTQTASDWISGITNEEVRGYVQTKGFKTPEALADSYRNLEKTFGVPKEQILKLPADLNGPEGEAVFQRLGKPEKADGYNLKAPEGAKEADTEFLNWAKEAFHKSNMTTKQAENLLSQWNEFQGAHSQKTTQAMEVQAKAEVEALKTEWGNAHDQNINIAKAAAEKFGVKAEDIDGLQKTLGYKRTMNFFKDLGAKMGEANFVQGESAGNIGAMEAGTAKAQIALKKADGEFMRRYSSGDSLAKAEMAKLYKDAYPGELKI